MTNCPTEEVLLDYTAGRLDREQTTMFEQHAETCARCGELRTAQAAVWRSLDEWTPAPVSAGFNRELWRRIDSDTGTPWRERFAEAMRLSFWKPALPLALATALVVTAFVFDHSPRSTQNATAKSTATLVVTVGDADQLDRALDDIQLLREVDAESAAAKPDSRVM